MHFLKLKICSFDPKSNIHINVREYMFHLEILFSNHHIIFSDAQTVLNGIYEMRNFK